MIVSDWILLSRLRHYKIHRFFENKENKEWWKGHFLGRTQIVTPEDSNAYLRNLILSKEHYFVARIGGVETEAMVYQDMVDRHALAHFPPKAKEALAVQAGMFSSGSKDIQLFSEYYKKALTDSTAFSYWQNDGEKMITKNWVNPKAVLFHYRALNAVCFPESFLRSLKGKKVLVISSFTETIKKQYVRRRRLFSDPELLPSFDLVVYQSVVTNGGGQSRYHTWEDALLGMADDASKISCDVVLLACGAYGLPLGDLLYRRGFNVIVCGGVLQNYFGIRGKVYEKNPDFAPYMNNYWVRPAKEETPPEFRKIEDGCYW